MRLNRNKLLWLSGERLANKSLSEIRQEVLIIGKDVETFARSPKLWNSVFSEYNSPIRMTPLNLELDSAMELGVFLDSRTDFLGCAIGFPNKQKSADFIDYPDAKSGINVLRKQGNFYEGYNSDGVAALHALQKELENTDFFPSKILILGTGSTASAFYNAVKQGDSNLSDCEILFYSRTHNTKEDKVCTSQGFEVERFVSSEPVIIVNATPNGSASKPELLPLSEDLVQFIHKQSVVLDFNYNSPNSLFRNLVASHGIHFADGMVMNLIQAVLSFEFVFKGFDIPNRQDLFSIMSRVG